MRERGSEEDERRVRKMREVRPKKLKRHPNKRTGKMNFQELTTLQRISLSTLNAQKHQQGTGYFYMWLGIATDLICMIYEGVNKTPTQYFVKKALHLPKVV